MLNWIVWNRLFICIKMDLALNNLQRLICHKTQTNKQTLNKSIWLIVRRLTVTTILAQNGPGSNGPMKGYSTLRCSLVSYTWHLYFIFFYQGGVLTHLQGIQPAYSKRCKQDNFFYKCCFLRKPCNINLYSCIRVPHEV